MRLGVGDFPPQAGAVYPRHPQTLNICVQRLAIHKLLKNYCYTPVYSNRDTILPETNIRNQLYTFYLKFTSSTRRKYFEGLGAQEQAPH